MKNLLFLVLSFFLVACQSEAPSLTAFRVIDEQTFEMCFSQEVEGLYALVIKTKSGKEIKKAGQLVPAKGNCFVEQKMQSGPGPGMVEK